MPEFPSPKHWVRVSNACNNNCLFCHDSENRGENPSRERISADLRRGIEAGYSAVVLSGGEPTLNRDLAAIVREAKEMGYERVQVVTNGRAFAYDDFCRLMADVGLDEATFSFYSHREKTHDILANVPGAFVQSLKGLVNALQSGKFIVNIDLVVNRLNVMTLEESIVFFHTMGVTEFDLLYLIPFGRAYENRNMLFMDAAQCAPAIRTALERCRRDGIRAWANRVPPPALEGCEWSLQQPEKIVSEVLSHSYVFDNYLAGGEKPDCFGDRCPFCFLEDFCLRLDEQEQMRRSGGQPLIFADLSAGPFDFSSYFSEEKDAGELWIMGSSGEIARVLQAGLPPHGAVCVGISESDDVNRRIRDILVSAPDINVNRWILAAPPGPDIFSQTDAAFWIPLSGKNIRLVEQLSESVSSAEKRVVFFQPSFFRFSSGADEAFADPRLLIGNMPFVPSGVYQLPECLTGRVPRIPAKKFFYPHILNVDGHISLEKFARAYIRRMYFSKSFRCRSCARDSRCRGIHIDDIANGLGLSFCSPIPPKTRLNSN